MTVSRDFLLRILVNGDSKESEQQAVFKVENVRNHKYSKYGHDGKKEKKKTKAKLIRTSSKQLSSHIEVVPGSVDYSDSRLAARYATHTC